MISLNNFINLTFDRKTINRIQILVILFTLFIILGFYWGDLIYKPVPNPHYNQINHISFRKIFFNNYLVALILVFFGYFSGGGGTVFIIILNGLNFGFELNYLELNIVGGYFGFIGRLIFHAPLEIFALCLMGNIGLRGFDIINQFIKTKEFSLSQDLITKQMVYQYFLGTFLLFLAAIIEVMVSKII